MVFARYRSSECEAEVVRIRYRSAAKLRSHRTACNVRRKAVYGESEVHLRQPSLMPLEKAKFAFHVCPRQTEVYCRGHALSPRSLLEKPPTYSLIPSATKWLLELSRELVEEYDLTLSAAVATVPTITEIGMAALMPGAEHGVKIKADKGEKARLSRWTGAQLEDRRHRIDHIER